MAVGVSSRRAGFGTGSATGVGATLTIGAVSAVAEVAAGGAGGCMASALALLRWNEIAAVAQNTNPRANKPPSAIARTRVGRWGGSCSDG